MEEIQAKNQIDHWTDLERESLRKASSFEEAAEVALTILRKMKSEGKPIVTVCGPLTTGGLGSIEKNGARFQQAVLAATENDLLVFDPLPFEDVIVRLKNPESDYDTNILEIFYKKIFEAGLIDKFLFLPDWQSSKGATWEREMATKLNIHTEEYPTDWLTSVP